MTKVLESFFRLLAWVVILTSLIGFPYAGYQILDKILAMEWDENPEVFAALVAGSATVIVSVFSVLAARHYEKQKDIRQEHIGRKTDLYENIIAFWFKMLFAAKLGENTPNVKDILQFMDKTTKELITWGGDGVLEAFVSVRKVSSDNSNPRGVMLAFEKLLLAIRSDLGHSNSGISDGDILRLFITDWDSEST